MHRITDTAAGLWEAAARAWYHAWAWARRAAHRRHVMVPIAGHMMGSGTGAVTAVARRCLYCPHVDAVVLPGHWTAATLRGYEMPAAAYQPPPDRAAEPDRPAGVAR